MAIVPPVGLLRLVQETSCHLAACLVHHLREVAVRLVVQQLVRAAEFLLE